MFDRNNRSAMPLIEGRACQQRESRPPDGIGREFGNNPPSATALDPDLYAIVHDLKNRLTSIKGWAELLQRRATAGADPSVILEGLMMVRSSVDAMDERLGEILAVGRLKIDDQRRHMPVEVDLWALAERLVTQHRALTENHEFVLVGPGSGQMVGNWAAGSVERILSNLLSNAVKYSLLGGQIVVSVELAGQEARLAVHDHGIGIPGPALAHIFEPFYRVGDAVGAHDVAHVSGFGIGLFAARTLAQQLNGRIEVTSIERQGGTFTLILPMRNDLCTGSCAC